MFPNMNRSIGCLMLALLALSLWGCAEQEPVSVSDARIRELIAGRTTTAAYFSLHNHTSVALTLTGAESALTGSIEMHTMVTEGERVGMRRVPEVVIEAGDRAEFAPGSLHLMVFGVEDLQTPFPITLVFADGTRLPVDFTILSLTPGT